MQDIKNCTVQKKSNFFDVGENPRGKYVVYF
jgi:hypothetical protein